MKVKYKKKVFTQCCKQKSLHIFIFFRKKKGKVMKNIQTLILQNILLFFGHNCFLNNEGIITNVRVIRTKTETQNTLIRTYFRKMNTL